jgi:hypothetical protein
MRNTVPPLAFNDLFNGLDRYKASLRESLHALEEIRREIEPSSPSNFNRSPRFQKCCSDWIAFVIETNYKWISSFIFISNLTMATSI